MIRLNKALIVVALVSVPALSGCSQRPGDLTLLSTKNVDLSDAELNLSDGKRVTGEHCVPVVLFPLGFPDLKEATDRALEEGDGNIMIDQVTTITNKSFLFGAHCIESEGTVLNLASAP